MPIYPLYDITKNSIQQSILELQQKIRKRREIQQQLQEEIIIMNEKLNEEMNYVDFLAKKQTINLQRQTQFQMAKKYNYPQLVINQSAYKDVIQYDQPLSQDESELVYKYYKGIKAAEYFKELELLQYNKKVLDRQNQINMKRLNNEIKLSNQSNRYSQSIKKYRTPERQKLNQRSNDKDTKKKEKNNFYDDKIIQTGVQTISHSNKKSESYLAKKSKKKQFSPNKILDLILKQKQKQFQKSNSPYKIIKESPQKNYCMQNNLKSNNQRQMIFINRKDSKRKRKQSKKVYGNTIHVDKTSLALKQNSLFSYYNQKKKKGFKSSRSKSQSKSKNQKSKFSYGNISQDKIYIPAPNFPKYQTIDHQDFYFQKIKQFCHKSKFAIKIEIQKRLILSQVIYKDSKLRNNRHQIGHLAHKFQNQLKLRKQIKDKINKNPRILKKHKMVVQ